MSSHAPAFSSPSTTDEGGHAASTTSAPATGAAPAADSSASLTTVAAGTSGPGNATVSTSSPRPTSGGAMAQLGLVPAGAAMSIIRNQSNPSTNTSTIGATFPGQANNIANGSGNASPMNQPTAPVAPAVQSSSGPQPLQEGASATNGIGIVSSNSNMPPGLVYPALHLHPVNDTFAPKQINLAPPGPHNRIRIGRQTNAKTVPHPSNGYFDSKVLSRMHAEVWSQDGKVYIKDIKSSNGTFINGDRLSPEAQESEIYELHNEDLVEFGIDIVGDDNKTIIHHKVACRVYLVITAEDALGMRNDFNSLYHGGHRAPLGHNGIGPGAEGGLRRGKNQGMSFDHILSRLQNELQKSRETGNELGGLTTTFSDIHDTLGGGLAPTSQPSYQHMVPPLVSESDAAANKAAIEDAKKQSAQVAALQTSLVETQASLAAHVDKIRTLESMLAEHEQIKAEVGLLKYQMELAKHEVDVMIQSRREAAPTGRTSTAAGSDAEEDFDDGASVASVYTVTQDTAGNEMPKLPKGVDEVEGVAFEAKHAAPRDHIGPAAPPDVPPHLMAKGTEIVDSPSSSAALDDLTKQFEARNAALVHRLESLEGQLEQALSLGRDLQGRVQSLEAQVAEKAKVIEGTANSMKAMEGRWAEWREQIEEGWRRERKGWEEEREHIRSVVLAWDEANKKLEEEVANASCAPGSSLRAGGGSQTPSSGGAGKRRGSKNAKRRAGKRHVNRDLRALLYKADFNRDASTLLSSDEADDDEADHKSTSTTDRSTSSSTASGSGSAGKASTTATSPPLTASNASSGSEDGTRNIRGASSTAKKVANSLSQKLGSNGGEDAPTLPFMFKDNAAALPLLTACGVVLVGAAAWAFAKKEKT